MSEKRELINEMLEMQKKFIEYEHRQGLDPKDYYAPEGGHPLDGFRDQYMNAAMKVVELAHAEVGSRR